MTTSRHGITDFRCPLVAVFRGTPKLRGGRRHENPGTIKLPLRAALIGGACALALAGAAAAQTRDFNVPAGDLKTALDAYARQAGVEVIYRVEDVRGAKTKGVHGALSARAALADILEGTPFQVQVDQSGALAVVRVGNGGGARAEAATAVQEVVVTANKRPEAVRKISGSVTAFTGQQLEDMGASSFSDYLTRTPGVVFNDAGASWSSATIRGVSTTTFFDTGQGTTGYFINDVPLTDPFFTVSIPDIDAFDVDNITVLRGPQGTLFGSATLGGAINYQAARPNLSDYQVHTQATFESGRPWRCGRRRQTDGQPACRGW